MRKQKEKKDFKKLILEFNIWKMPRKEYPGVRISSYEDLPLIRNNHGDPRQTIKAEREFGRLLLDKTDLEITYEPTFFYYIDEDEIKRGTLPDYRVRNPHTGAQTYIELTTSDGGKGRQVTLMQQLAPDVHYVVFTKKKLLALELKFPGYHFLNGDGPPK